MFQVWAESCLGCRNSYFYENSWVFLDFTPLKITLGKKRPESDPLWLGSQWWLLKKIWSCQQLTTRWMVHLITPYSTGSHCYSETWNQRVWTPEWRHGCGKGRAEHAAVLPGVQEEKLQKCNQTTECHFSAGSHKALEPRVTSKKLSWKEFCNTLEFSSKTTPNLK